MSEEIHALVSPAKYQESRAHLFPSPQSFSWFLRNHRAEMVAKGALLLLAGRNTIHAEKADQVVLEVGQRNAQDSKASRTGPRPSRAHVPVEVAT